MKVWGEIEDKLAKLPRHAPGEAGKFFVEGPATSGKPWRWMGKGGFLLPAVLREAAQAKGATWRCWERWITWK